MAQKCLKCLKYIMCAFNFLFFISGVIMLGFGVFMIRLQATSLLPSMKFVTAANLLLIAGIIITCISFLGFIGALRENRCLLLTFFILLLILMLVELAIACFLLVYEKEIGVVVEMELTEGLNNRKNNNASTELGSDWDLVQMTFGCCGVHNSSEWGEPVPESCCHPYPCPTPKAYHKKGCLVELKDWFERNFLSTGITVIVLCVVEVLGMCISMTLFCHISSSGLGYKL